MKEFETENIFIASVFFELTFRDKFILDRQYETIKHTANNPIFLYKKIYCQYQNLGIDIKNISQILFLRLYFFTHILNFSLKFLIVNIRAKLFLYFFPSKSG